MENEIRKIGFQPGVSRLASKYLPYTRDNIRILGSEESDIPDLLTTAEATELLRNNMFPVTCSTILQALPDSKEVIGVRMFGAGRGISGHG